MEKLQLPTIFATAAIVVIGLFLMNKVINLVF
jgi:hypothetical protein